VLLLACAASKLTGVIGNASLTVCSVLPCPEAACSVSQGKEAGRAAERGDWRMGQFGLGEIRV